MGLRGTAPGHMASVGTLWASVWSDCLNSSGFTVKRAQSNTKSALLHFDSLGTFSKCFPRGPMSGDQFALKCWIEIYGRFLSKDEEYVMFPHQKKTFTCCTESICFCTEVHYFLTCLRCCVSTLWENISQMHGIAKYCPHAVVAH